MQRINKTCAEIVCACEVLPDIINSVEGWEHAESCCVYWDFLLALNKRRFLGGLAGLQLRFLFCMWICGNVPVIRNTWQWKMFQTERILHNFLFLSHPITSVVFQHRRLNIFLSFKSTDKSHGNFQVALGKEAEMIHILQNSTLICLDFLFWGPPVMHNLCNVLVIPSIMLSAKFVVFIAFILCQST